MDTFHTFHWGDKGEDGVWRGNPYHVTDVQNLLEESAMRQGIDWPYGPVAENNSTVIQPLLRANVLILLRYFARTLRDVESATHGVTVRLAQGALRTLRLNENMDSPRTSLHSITSGLMIHRHTYYRSCIPL